MTHAPASPPPSPALRRDTPRRPAPQSASARRWPLAGGLAAATMMLAASGAAAHVPVLLRSEPAGGDQVCGAPRQVTLWSQAELDARLSSLTVSGPNQTPADQGGGKVDLSDPERKRLAAPLRDGLGPGVYTVAWKLASNDDKESAEGSFSFTVKNGCLPFDPMAGLLGAAVVAAGAVAVVARRRGPRPARE